jgi:hypothetical protein
MRNSRPQFIFTSRRTPRVWLTVFGVLFSLLAVILQSLPYPDWSSRVAAFLMLTLPVGSLGLYFLHAAWLLRQARVVINETGVALNLPNYQAGWLFRSVPVQLRWEDICCVQHERQPLIAGGKLIDHYWIHSSLGMFLLTQDTCREAADVARLIAERKGSALTAAAPEAVPQPLAPAEEEAQLKRNAVVIVVILVALIGGIVLAVTSETPVGQMVLAGMRWLSQLMNLLFIIVTVASIFGLWWNARRERLRLQQKQPGEKM